MGGYREPRYLEETVSYTWATIATNTTNEAPGTDTVMQISNARSITIQISTDNAGNASADLDVNVMTSMDATTNFDNVPFAERNIGSTSVKTFLVNTGPAYMRLRVDNNSLTGAGSVTAIVLQRS